MKVKTTSQALADQQKYRVYVITGKVFAAKKYISQTVSGGGSSFLNHEKIEPISTSTQVDKEFWLRAEDGKDYRFELDIPVANGQRVSIFLYGDGILFAAYNHNSDLYYQYVEREKIIYRPWKRFVLIIAMMTFVYYLYSLGEGFGRFLAYANGAAFGVVSLILLLTAYTGRPDKELEDNKEFLFRQFDEKMSEITGN